MQFLRALEIPASEIAVETTEPNRPLSEFVREIFGEGVVADTMELVIEPALQILLIVVLAVVAKMVANRLIARFVTRMKTPDPGFQRWRHRLGEGSTGTSTLRRANRADALGTLLRSIAGVAIWTVGLFSILGVFGISLAPLIAGAGIIGLAIGFGAQRLVSDFLSGLFMLVEDQYGVGDVIDVGEATGVVEGVSLRTTRIRDVTGTLWHVPNGEIRRVGNMSQEWARALLDVGVAYGTDVDLASEIIKRVADEMAAEEVYTPLFLAEPEIWGVQNLGPDSVDIRLVIKTQPGEQWAISRELRRRLKQAFDDAGIEIPFPQRTIWLRTDAPAE